MRIQKLHYQDIHGAGFEYLYKEMNDSNGGEVQTTVNNQTGEIKQNIDWTSLYGTLQERRL